MRCQSGEICWMYLPSMAEPSARSTKSSRGAGIATVGQGLPAASSAGSPQWIGQETLAGTSRATQMRRKILWAFGWRPALFQSEVADAPTLEPTMLKDAPWPAQAAIRTDLGAIFVSIELSRRTWLITSLSPGAGEKIVRRQSI